MQNTRSRSEHIRKIFSIQELLKDTDGTEAAPVLKRRLKELKARNLPKKSTWWKNGKRSGINTSERPYLYGPG